MLPRHTGRKKNEALCLLWKCGLFCGAHESPHNFKKYDVINHAHLSTRAPQRASNQLWRPPAAAVLSLMISATANAVVQKETTDVTGREAHLGGQTSFPLGGRCSANGCIALLQPYCYRQDRPNSTLLPIVSHSFSLC